MAGCPTSCCLLPVHEQCGIKRQGKMAQLDLVEICRNEKNKAIVNLHGESPLLELSDEPTILLLISLQ